MPASDPHNVDELWGKVEGLETGFAALGNEVKTGFTTLGNLIKESNDRSDRKVEGLANETRARFEREEKVYRETTAQRATTSLQVIGYLITGIFGVGSTITGIAGIGFALYTLTKAPIDQSFADINSKVARLEKEFTPKEQVAITETLAVKNQRDIENLEQIAAANTQARGDIVKSVDQLTTQVDLLRTNSVSKGELALLNDRVSLVSARVTPILPPK